mmetsp:Transcript_5754/g.13964  ORF Transcript_5754/g.13964 Transcript_5754/m.13964 type:complete len:154 (-) Transcript_5754:971-1432(-)
MAFQPCEGHTTELAEVLKVKLPLLRSFSLEIQRKAVQVEAIFNAQAILEASFLSGCPSSLPSTSSGEREGQYLRQWTRSASQTSKLEDEFAVPREQFAEKAGLYRHFAADACLFSLPGQDEGSSPVSTAMRSNSFSRITFCANGSAMPPSAIT